MTRFSRHPQLRIRHRLLVPVTLALAIMTGAAGATVATEFLRRGGALKAVQVVTEDLYFYANSLNYVDVPKMSLTLNVPAGERAVFVATFSGEAACAHHSQPAYCYLRVVLVNVGELVPGEVTFVAETSPIAANVAASHSMQFLAGPYPSGQYTFKVQVRTNSIGTNFIISKQTFTVWRAKAK